MYLKINCVLAFIHLFYQENFSHIILAVLAAFIAASMARVQGRYFAKISSLKSMSELTPI